eukprot:5493651-Ditylum_brightwellii.AAC.1
MSDFKMDADIAAQLNRYARSLLTDDENNGECYVDFDKENEESTSTRRIRTAEVSSFPSPMFSSSSSNNNKDNFANYFDDTKGEVYASNTMNNIATRKGGMDLFEKISSFQSMDTTDTDAKLAAQLQVKEAIMATSSSGDDNDAHA